MKHPRFMRLSYPTAMLASGMETAAAPPRKSRKFLIVLIINTVLSLLAILPAVAVLVASTMSGANASSSPRLGTMVVFTAFVMPALFPLAVLGSWLSMKWRRVSIAFIVLPWLFALFHAALLMMMFSGF